MPIHEWAVFIEREKDSNPWSRQKASPEKAIQIPKINKKDEKWGENTPWPGFFNVNDRVINR